MRLTSKVIDTVCENIRKGYPPRVACARARIAQRSYYRWLENGRKLAEGMDEGEREPETVFEDQYIEFYYKVEEAHADNIVRLNNELNDKENKQWQKTCWQMERRYRDDYGRFGQPLGHLKPNPDIMKRHTC